MIINNPRCPNCGSTAQVRHFVGGAYLCGCGQMFYVVNDEVKTATQICEEIEKMEKGLTNKSSYDIIQTERK